MVKFSKTIQVAGSRASCWKILADWRNSKNWDENIKECVLKPGHTDPYREAAEFDVTFDYKGRQQQVDYVVSEFTPEKKAVYIGTNAWVRSIDTLEFDDGDKPGLTNVTWTGNLVLRGLLRPFSFIFSKDMKVMGSAAMSKMEEYLKKELPRQT